MLYSDGIDVGYRWYDVKNETPLFPFGYGLSYTTFRYSDLQIDRTSVTGTDDVRVSATVTNTGYENGRGRRPAVPRRSGRVRRATAAAAGFQRVSLAPGQSERVSFTITPQQQSWWRTPTTAGPRPRAVQVYVGDSSALANLPLRGSYTMTSTPGARQVTISAPSTVSPGKAFRVKVTLTAGGGETLRNAQLALQLPPGWRPPRPTTFGTVRPARRSRRRSL